MGNMIVAVRRCWEGPLAGFPLITPFELFLRAGSSILVKKSGKKIMRHSSVSDFGVENSGSRAARTVALNSNLVETKPTPSAPSVGPLNQPERVMEAILCRRSFRSIVCLLIIDSVGRRILHYLLQDFIYTSDFSPNPIIRRFCMAKPAGTTFDSSEQR